MKPRDPRRWLDQSGPETELERSLLEVGLDMQPPPKAKDAVWAAMVGATALGGGAAAAASGASASGTSAGGAATGSAVAGGAAAGGAVAGGAVVAGSSTVGAGAAGGAAVTTAVKSSLGLGMVAKVSMIVGVLGVGAMVAKGPIMDARPAPSTPAPEMSLAPLVPSPAPAPAPHPNFDLTPAPEDLPVPLEASPTIAPPLAIAPSPALPSHRVNPSPIALPPRMNPSPAPDLTIALPPAISTLPPEARIASPDVSATPDAAAPPKQEANSSNADDMVDGPNGLADEAATVRAARQELRQGRARAARERLEKAASMFPDGALEEEREVLYIEALLKSGSLARAKAETASFLRAHPTSPHAARLRTLFGR